MYELKITTVGSSAGVVLPRPMLDRLRVGKGDMLYALETPKGFELTPYDPKFVEQVSMAEKVIRQDRDVLRKLAKG
jgi:putative addiction module antidote